MRLIPAQAYTFGATLLIYALLFVAKSAPAQSDVPVHDQPRLAFTYGHSAEDDIRHLQFSSDGQFLLSIGSNLAAVIWSIETGRELRRFQLNQKLGVSAALLQNARYLLSLRSDGSVVVRSIVTGREVWRDNLGMSPSLPKDLPPDLRSDLKTLIDAVDKQLSARSNLSRDEVTILTNSADGEYALFTTQDRTVVRVWSASKGRFSTALSHPREIQNAILLGGQKLVVTADTHTVWVWSLETGERLFRLEHDEALYSTMLQEGVGGDHANIKCSPNGEYLLTRDFDAVHVWSLQTGRKLWSLAACQDEPCSTHPSFWKLRFTPDSDYILTVGPPGDRFARLWSVESGQQINQIEFGSVQKSDSSWLPEGHYFNKVSFSPKEEYLVSAGSSGAVGFGGNVIKLWSLKTGELRHQFDGFPGLDRVKSAEFAPNERFFRFKTSSDDRIFSAEDGLIDNYKKIVAWSGEDPPKHIIMRKDNGMQMSLLSTNPPFEIQKFTYDNFLFPPEHAKISPNKKYVVAKWSLGEVSLLSVSSGDVLYKFKADYDHPVEFSSDSEHLLTLHDDSVATLRSVSTGNIVRSFKHLPRWEFGGHIQAAVFSPDGKHVMTAGTDSTARLWSVETGEELSLLRQSSEVKSVTFLPGGERILTGGSDGITRLWSVGEGEIISRFYGHVGDVNSIDVSKDGKRIITAGDDGTSRLWSLDPQRLIAQFVFFDNDSWVVVDALGRFDTNDFDYLPLLHWIYPEYPLTPVPIESYVREYYEPGLLSRLLSGESLPEPQSTAKLNIAQPKVNITQVDAEPGESTVAVSIQVVSRYQRFTTNDGPVYYDSKAYDLRLFRDGQLVGYIDGDLGLGESDSLTHTFTGIRLPRQASVDEVEFSAYAFNSDRVKSSTARLSYPVPKALGLHKGRAYVITLGVDAFADSTWNLDFAAADARLLSETILNRLRESRRYDKVVPVPLIAAQESSTDARKAVIRSALDLLAGRTVDPALRARIPNADQIETATPEDLVLFSASTHGYTDSTGVFYLFPQDIETVSGEKNRITPSLLRSAISSDELSLWLRDVDAGTLTMIVDACHSAAAVEGAGFKPGPMGSRGLGQLAYNKGMQILAASQASDVAWESALLGHGLLTHALVRDGLISRQSDHAPEDGQVGLTEWLQYGAERVPALYEEVQEGRIQTFGRGGETSRSTVVGSRTRDAYFQRPSLFDFRRRTDDVVLQFE